MDVGARWTDMNSSETAYLLGFSFMSLWSEIRKDKQVQVIK